jgi:hypothetical protein
MGALSRRKGVAGEREVVAVFREFDIGGRVERAGFGTFQLSGDLAGLPGCIVSVKRAEVLRLPLWIREADALADGTGDVPIVAYRTSAHGPVPRWRADLPLRDFARLLDLARLTA